MHRTEVKAKILLFLSQKGSFMTRFLIVSKGGDFDTLFGY